MLNLTSKVTVSQVNHPQNNRDLGLLHLWSKFGDLIIGRTDGRTDRRALGRTDAGNDNT